MLSPSQIADQIEELRGEAFKRAGRGEEVSSLCDLCDQAARFAVRGQIESAALVLRTRRLLPEPARPAARIVKFPAPGRRAASG